MLLSLKETPAQRNSLRVGAIYLVVALAAFQTFNSCLSSTLFLKQFLCMQKICEKTAQIPYDSSPMQQQEEKFRPVFAGQVETQTILQSSLYKVKDIPPWAMFKRYQKRHSSYQLQKELDECRRRKRLQSDFAASNFTIDLQRGDCPELANRKFSVGYYSAPQQAGNRLHHFIDSMLWSIATNRTLLWKYYSQSDCFRVGLSDDPRICISSNTQEEGEKVLRISSWVPAYEQWKSVLDLGYPEEISFHSTHVVPQDENERARFLRKHPLEDGFTNHNGIDANSTRFIHFGIPNWRVFGLNLSNRREQELKLHTYAARQKTRQLLSFGSAFPYGMVFNEAFLINEALFPPPEWADSTAQKYDVRVGVHSRHFRKDDDGSNIEKEKKCLHEVLVSRNTSSILSGDKSCAVFIMADRPKSIELLSEEAKSMNCIAVSTNHTEKIETSFSIEHGPFAGAEFYRDLLLVSSNVRDGFSFFRNSTSSRLVDAILEFSLQLGDRQNGRLGPSNTKNFNRCMSVL